MTDPDLAELRRTAEWARHDPYAVVATGDEVLRILDHIESLEARLARVTDGSAVEAAAEAAYEQAFLKHAPEDVDRWDDLVADDAPAAESWREVARAVIRAVAAGDQTEGDDQ